MSADEKLNDRKSRRALRRQAEAAVQNVEVDQELDEAEEGEDDDSSARSLSLGKGRATPGRRTLEIAESKAEGNFLTRAVRSVRDYIEGVRSEIQKVVWPTREEVRRLTTIVLVVTIIGAIVLGLLSLIFNALIAAGLQTPAIFAVLIALVIVAFVVYLRMTNRRASSF